MKINRVGHIVLNVRGLEAAKQFYAGVMQMHITDEVPGFGAFFRFSDYHHDIGVFKVSDDGSTPTRGRAGLAHLALLVDDIDALKDAYRQLKAAGAEVVATADHGITRSFYVHDPEGNEIEIYCETEGVHWREIPKIMKQPKPLQLD